MVNAQEWLNREYPKEERNKIQEIYLFEPNLEGELDLSDFTYQCHLQDFISIKEKVTIYISFQIDETKLIIKSLPNGARIVRLVRAQEYINHYYPTKEEREKVEELDISSIQNGVLDCFGFCSTTNSDKNLEGELDLSEFINLRKLDCSDNFLTKIILPNNPDKLEWLDLSNNNISDQNLLFLAPYTNLKWVRLGDYSCYYATKTDKDTIEDIICKQIIRNYYEDFASRKIKRGIYNRFINCLGPYQGGDNDKLNAWKKDNLDLIINEKELLQKGIEEIEKGSISEREEIKNQIELPNK